MSSRILTSPESARLSATSRQVHPRCVLCNPGNPMGLGLQFLVTRDGAVQAEFCGSAALEGYPGLLHGGVIGALLDSAMTNCLFAHDCPAFTAELAVRYRHPVSASDRMIIRAWKMESHGPLHLLQAELRQNEMVKTTAQGKFFELRKRPVMGRSTETKIEPASGPGCASPECPAL